MFRRTFYGCSCALVRNMRHNENTGSFNFIILTTHYIERQYIYRRESVAGRTVDYDVRGDDGMVTTATLETEHRKLWK